MTTIATDGQTMAGDGRTTSGWTIASDVAIKVHRLTDGRIVGASGNASECRRLIAYLEDPTIKFEPKEVTALILHPCGRIECIDASLHPFDLPAPQVIGCGGDIALGAMRMGATPAEAVKIACENNAGSGGLITVLDRSKP